MITIALLDDEKEYICKARETVNMALLDPCACDNEYNIQSFTSSAELIEYSADRQIDILILDIHMPEPSGIAVAEHFHAEHENTLIIFLSNYEEYVFYSFRFSPFRFVRKAYMEHELTEAVISAVDNLTPKQNYMEVTRGQSRQLVPYSKIMYIEKVKGKNYLTLYLADEALTLRQNISSLEKEMSAFGFTKISSGTLVNMKYIHKISGESMTLQDGTVLKISGGYGGRLKAVKEDFIKYMRSTRIR
ncbi:MAG: LytTR family transcriptional regulator DNA-binding domain-containing protein [Clostridia bacterium]|nr:LytTR family transcriptional regulator DNA-binding domain-containing protein [Clostridia bacterium]